jgi:hypothetical protein
MNKTLDAQQLNSLAIDEKKEEDLQCGGRGREDVMSL